MKIYLPISMDEELAVEITHRGWNGIDSDPKIEVRSATLAEAAIALHVIGRDFFRRGAAGKHAGFFGGSQVSTEWPEAGAGRGYQRVGGAGQGK